MRYPGGYLDYQYPKNGNKNLKYSKDETTMASTTTRETMMDTMPRMTIMTMTYLEMMT